MCAGVALTVGEGWAQRLAEQSAPFEGQGAEPEEDTRR